MYGCDGQESTNVWLYSVPEKCLWTHPQNPATVVRQTWVVGSFLLLLHMTIYMSISNDLTVTSLLLPGVPYIGMDVKQDIHLFKLSY